MHLDGDTMFNRLMGSVLACLLLSLSPVVSEAPASAATGDRLTVTPSYDGNATLTTNSIEWHDALPSYSMSLVEVATGRPIALQYGYADHMAYSELETGYHSTTAEPLQLGASYEVLFTTHTTSFWHCSKYDEDGCSWLEGGTVSTRWRFTYSGGTVEAAEYVPPLTTTKLGLSPKVQWRQRGWRITVTLTGDGAPMPKQKVIGQYRLDGGWRKDTTFKTNAKGQVRVSFDGEQRRTSYRFVYEGTDTAKATKSRPILITRR